MLEGVFEEAKLHCVSVCPCVRVSVFPPFSFALLALRVVLDLGFRA